MNRRRIGIYIAIAAIPLLIGTALAGWDIWRESTLYVKTKDAQVSAPVVNAQANVAGRLGQYLVDVGDVVSQGDVVASLNASSAPAPAAAAGGIAAQVVVPSRFTVNVRAPVSGTVISKAALSGASVTAGQTLLTIGDLDSISITANIDESRVAHVRPGQPADVYISALDRTFPGQVVEVTPATVAVANPAPAQSRTTTTSSTARPVQSVPVRIELDRPQLAGVTLLPGMSAEVKIAVG
jgi:multidrug resistance efflux pump